MSAERTKSEAFETRHDRTTPILDEWRERGAALTTVSVSTQPR